jgi:hypothetical protein
MNDQIELEQERGGDEPSDGEPEQFRLGMNDRMTEWANEPDLQALKSDFDSCKVSHDAIVANIKRWNNLLRVEGEAKPPKVKNRSQVQPKLVRRQAEWRYSALSEPFNSSEKTFKVSPVTHKDGPASNQNEKVLNHQFRNKLNRVQFVDNLVRAVVDEGTVIVRLGWSRQVVKHTVEVPVYEYYEIETEEQMNYLGQVIQLAQQDPDSLSSLAPEWQAAANYYMETQIPVYAVQVGTEQQEEEVVLDNRPTVEVKNPNNIYIDPSCQGDLDKALFIIESFETNRAELEKEPGRYKNLDKVLWDSNSALTDPDHATSTPSTFEFRDKARKKVVAYEYWGYYDVDGNGTLKAIVVTWIGNQVIRMEENPYPDQKLPYVVIPYSPVKRELYGEPDAELLGDNQAILGAVMRGMIDSLARSANAQKGYARGMLDPINQRKYENGQDYEFNPNIPTNQGIIEHKFPEIPQSAMLMLNLQNQEAESLTGVKAFSGGLSGNAYGDVAAGIKGMIDAAAKREMAILRRIAKGVSDIGKKIIQMNGAFMEKPEVINITDEQFVEISMEQLKGEFDCIVDISTYEVDNAKAQDLGFMLQTLGPNIDPGIAMEILAQIADLKRMPELAYTLRNWQPKPDPVQQQLQQLQVQKAQMEVVELQAKIQLLQAQARAALATAGQKELERVQEETGVNHLRALDLAGAQSRSNESLEITKGLMRPVKEGEKAPDILPAVGWRELSHQLDTEKARST